MRDKDERIKFHAYLTKRVNAAIQLFVQLQVRFGVVFQEQCGESVDEEDFVCG